MKSASGASGTLRRSPPAMITAYWWIGYAGSGHSTTSPGPTVTSMKCERPSFAPITAIASVSGIERDAVAALVPLGDGGAQVRHAARRRVAVVARVARGLADLLDHVRRRREVGVAHAEVDHVLAGAARGVGERGHLREARRAAGGGACGSRGGSRTRRLPKRGVSGGGAGRRSYGTTSRGASGVQVTGRLPGRGRTFSVSAPSFEASRTCVRLRKRSVPFLPPDPEA